MRMLTLQRAASSLQQELGAVSELGLAVLFSKAGRPSSPSCLWDLRPREQDVESDKEQEKDGFRAQTGLLVLQGTDALAAVGIGEHYHTYLGQV